MKDREKLKALENLRGEHDQRIRCKAIHILYGPTTHSRTETEIFLEAEIARLIKRISDHDRNP